MPGLFRVGVSILIEYENRVLLLRRAGTKDHGANEWEPVSGRLESGEEPYGAAKREVLEETGLEVEIEGPIDTFSFIRQPEGEELIGITFVARADQEEVRLSEEHTSYRWVQWCDLLEADVSPGIKACLVRYLKSRVDPQ